MKERILFIFLFIFIFFNSYGQDDFNEMKNNKKDIEYKVNLKIESNEAYFHITVVFPQKYFQKKIIVSAKPSLSGVINNTDWVSQIFVGENIKNLEGAENVNYSSGGNFTFIRSIDLTTNTYGELNFNLSLYVEKNLLTEYNETFFLKGGQVVEEIENNQDNEEEIENSNNQETEVIETEDDTTNIYIDVDDLKAEINKKISQKKFSEVVDLQESLGEIYENEQKFDEAISVYREAIEYSEKNKTVVKTGDLYTDVAKLEYASNKNIEALDDYYEALERYKEKGETKRIELTYNNIATVYNAMLYYENAISAFTEALNNCSSEDIESLAKYNSKIADAYMNMEKLQEAVNFYEKTINLEENQGNTSELVTSLNNLSTIQLKLGNFGDAEATIDKALDFNNIDDDNFKSALLFNNLGNVFYNSKDYDKAIENYEKSIANSSTSGNYRSNAIALHNLGLIYLEKKDIEKAKEKFKESLKIAEENGFGDIISKNYYMISQAVAEKIECVEDFEEYQELMFQSNSVILNDNSPILDFQSKYISDYSKEELIAELNQKDIEIQKQKEVVKEQNLKNELLLLEKQITENQNKRQRKAIIYLIFGIVLILGLGLLALRESILKRKANQALTDKNAQILMQNEEIKAQAEELLDKNEKILEQNQNIEKANKKILASIVYAKNIQTAVLPSEKILNSYLKDYFVLYKPKDVVSGDFYWASKKNDDIFIVAADCTGHGVPGAMMSMLGITLLNEVVNVSNITETGKIIDKLREMVIYLLNTRVEDTEIDDEDKITRDGMDLALLKLDLVNDKVYFTGAENPLVIVREKELIEIEADYMAVGATTLSLQNKNFTTNCVEIKKNDMLFIFSDGYADQFGGPKEKRPKKFLKRNMYNLFIEISDNKPSEQKDILDKKFETWKGENKQIDDVLVIGFRV